MNRIILHWTAGAYKPNETDKTYYHFLIDSQGNVTKGNFPVLSNKVCKSTAQGRAMYAAHTGGGNTGSIGVALCGMYGFKDKNNVGKYPLTAVQCERAFKLIAELAKEYGITIGANTVMTHYEFGQSHKNTSSFGKIDIVYLPPYPNVTTDKVGDFIRNKAKWYKTKLN